MRNVLPLVRVAAAALGLAACYEWIPDYETPGCRATHRVDAPAHGGPPFALGTRGELRPQTTLRDPVGRVLDGDVGVRVARVRLTAAGASREVVVDSAGWFSLDGVAPGRYRLLAYGLGYLATWDSVSVPWDTATALEVRLRPSPTDGPCSGFAIVRVRRPWWQFWKLW